MFALFHIDLEPASSNEGDVFKVDEEVASPNEGACFRYMMNRNRQTKGGGVFKTYDEVEWPRSMMSHNRDTGTAQRAGMFKIYDEPESSNDGASFKIYPEPEAPNEGRL